MNGPLMGKAALDSTTSGTRRLFGQPLRAGDRARPATLHQNSNAFGRAGRDLVFNCMALRQRLAVSGEVEWNLLPKQSAGRTDAEAGRGVATSSEEIATEKFAKPNPNYHQAQKGGGSETLNNSQTGAIEQLALAVFGKIGQTLCGGCKATQGY